MFNHRYFLQGAVYGHAAKVEELSVSSTRFLRMSQFAHDLLGWFDAQPTLQSVQLSCVALAEVKKAPLQIYVRHHVKLIAVGGQVPDAEDYADGALPYTLLGNGSVTINRDDPEVRAYLAMPSGMSAEYAKLVRDLSIRIDEAYDSVEVIHDLGLASV
ncbi:hypothetical protein LC612_44085 [Nostoc sp. CHAB 5834]|nr:hypothetical protein [Nostoc sp. CHAB 5834]